MCVVVLNELMACCLCLCVCLRPSRPRVSESTHLCAIGSVTYGVGGSTVKSLGSHPAQRKVI